MNEWVLKAARPQLFLFDCNSVAYQRDNCFSSTQNEMNSLAWNEWKLRIVKCWKLLIFFYKFSDCEISTWNSEEVAEIQAGSYVHFPVELLQIVQGISF